MSVSRYTHFSDADMNVIIHEDSSFGALKTVHHPFWEWGTIGTFPTNGRGSEVLRTQKAKFFLVRRGKKIDINGSYFKHVGEEEDKPANH
jgi:hypothetical protein